jgi:hypothetical protein
VPIAGYGKLVPGQTLSLFTGWGTASAARAHQQLARHLREHGDVPDGAFGFDDKDELIGQTPYDDIVRRWSTATGRPVR